MRLRIGFLFSLGLCTLWYSPPALATSMKSTAPETMLSRDGARKMRACDERAMREKVPMDQKAAFVKKCMADMK
jgi:hypothetical protein